MAVRHINPNAKESSGVILSGSDAQKVFSLFEEPQTKEYIEAKKTKTQIDVSKITH
jgi:hypothetical protein